MLASLYKRMAQAYGKIEPLAKNGHNNFHNYAYVRDADVVDLVRRVLAEVGLALFTSVRAVNRTELATRSGAPKYRTVVHFVFTLADAETGATLASDWVAEADDQEDKGLNKAATAALKYFLLKTFMIPSDDAEDPDGAGQRRQAQAQAGGQRRQAQGQAPAQTPAPAQGQAPAPAPAGNGKAGATDFWKAAQAHIGDGKRFADRGAVMVWLNGHQGSTGTDWESAIKALGQ